MKNSLILLTVFLFLLCGNVQSQSREDAVYLHNGCILRGKVIENIKGVQTTVEIVGRNLLVIPDSTIKMILMDQEIPSKNRISNPSPFGIAAQLNFYGGSENSGGFTFAPSYTFPSRISTGILFGVEWFNYQQMPLMGEVKYYILKKACSPYIFAHCGYSFPLSKNMESNYIENFGGIVAGTGVGIRYNFARRNALIFNLGYRYQKSKIVTGSAPWSSVYPRVETIRYKELNRLTFSFGFLFN